MTKSGIYEEIVVRPIGGMQLSEGRISESGRARFHGSLPGIDTLEGDSLEDVLRRLEIKAKAYYGDDVIVELVSKVSTDYRTALL